MSDARGADAFARLGPEVRSALSDRGFDSPTEPQRRAVPPIADGEDTLVVAPTGTGKTESAMLPVFDALAGDERFGVGALYVTPLRALNRDMRERLDWWGDRLDLDVDVRHGDTSDYHRSKQADDPPDVLVTTPETLQAMLTGSKLRRALADVDHVVVDEVHELAGSKRGAQLAVGLERVRELSGPFQRVGLSATVGAPREVARFLTGDRSCRIAEVDVGSDLAVSVRVPRVTEADEDLAGELMTQPDVASHVRAIREEVERHESTLVFVNTRQTAEALGSRLKNLDANVEVHHGSLAKGARVDIEDRFKAGEIDGLLCTSSMELGIDVGRIDHVVQYQSPRQVARLLQRVGRAGHRQDRTSTGTVVASRPDEVLEALAVARRATAGHVEPANIHHGSLDTVANQVAGLTFGQGEVSAREAYDVVTRAYPFADLAESEFRSVVEELSNNRVLWLDREADRLESSGTFQYVYANLSMIPDEATYEVRDMASGRQVGTLDERFVVNFAATGEVFIQGGEMWRVTEVDDEDDVVRVTPIEDPGGEVPAWIGQEIPVPFHVAQEVGELRGTVGRQLADGADVEAVARDVATRYPVDPEDLAPALERLAGHVDAGHPVPTEDVVVAEGEPRSVVLNAAFGHAVNETLGRAVAALVGQATGSSVGVEVDPYRVELEVPPKVSATDVVDHLLDTDPDHLRGILELALKNADRLKFVLAQVAAKFGRVEDGASPSPDRLLSALEGTPVYEEAVRQVFHEDLDVAGARETLASLRDGDRSLERVGGRTPVGRGGRSSGRELLAPENADASVIDAVRERLQDDPVVLVCVHCGDWKRRTKVGRVPDRPECAECGATRVAALSPWAEDTIAAVTSGDPSEDESDLLERAHRNANLVQGHGQRAVTALAARGVGPTNAARIIGKLRENEDAFYRDILEREREYARTRSFWD
jgi:ATP-dependent Lhr-like helicase